jgi:hypothetical protein
VSLPDGRIQIVSYKVSDENSGFLAEVRYEGNPKTPIEAGNKRYELKTQCGNYECLTQTDIGASSNLQPIYLTPDNIEENDAINDLSSK